MAKLAGVDVVFEMLGVRASYEALVAKQHRKINCHRRNNDYQPTKI